jgi:hypothetical protein
MQQCRVFFGMNYPAASGRGIEIQIRSQDFVASAGEFDPGKIKPPKLKPNLGGSGKVYYWDHFSTNPPGGGQVCRPA